MPVGIRSRLYVSASVQRDDGNVPADDIIAQAELGKPVRQLISAKN